MGVCTRDEPMYIVTELMVNGSLLEYLHKHNDGIILIMLNHIIDMAAQVQYYISYILVWLYSALITEKRRCNTLVPKQTQKQSTEVNGH